MSTRTHTPYPMASFKYRRRTSRHRSALLSLPSLCSVHVSRHATHRKSFWL